MHSKTLLILFVFWFSMNRVQAQISVVGDSTTIDQADTTEERFDVKEDSLTVKLISTEEVEPSKKSGRSLTKGRLEIGGIQGIVPFTTEGTGAWNAFAKGNLSIELLGIPVGVLLDVGTDVPVRGQRNTIRFSFDAPRALNVAQWDDARLAHRWTSELDSVERLCGEQDRKLKGAEARLSAIEAYITMQGFSEEQLDTGFLMPDSVVPLHPTSIRGLDGSTERARNASLGRLDSLRSSLAEMRERSIELSAVLQNKRMVVERQQALMNARHSKEGMVAQFAKGIKRLDIGTCSPNTSEFLINGLNFQGLSFEYAHKDVFFSLDRGRSFDDTWQNTDPVSRNLRQLQQSLFFTDTRDHNPRKLTAVRGGFGEVGRTHVHVGYLNGKRNDLPFGSVQPNTSVISLMNHVVEFDIGASIKKAHLLRMVYARSIVQHPSGSDDTGIPSGAVADLFNVQDKKDQALKLIWTTELERTGTRIDLEGRTISPFFQSFGMGFVRNGSRAVELRLDQRIGERSRLRIRSTSEERMTPTASTNGRMTIQRIQALFSYRPSRALTLRAGYLPVWTRTTLGNGDVVGAINRSYSAGGDLRKRWRKLELICNTDVGLFAWNSTDGEQQQVENHSIGFGLQHEERWSMRLAWTGMSGVGDKLVTNSSNLTFRSTYSTRTGFSGDVSMQLPYGYDIGWLVGVQRTTSNRVTLRLSGQHYSRSASLFMNNQSFIENASYTWTASVIYQW